MFLAVANNPVRRGIPPRGNNVLPWEKAGRIISQRDKRLFAPIAQLVEQVPLKDKAQGSNPCGGINISADVAELADAHGLGPCTVRYGGSSPSVRRFVKNRCLPSVVPDASFHSERPGFSAGVIQR